MGASNTQGKLVAESILRFFPGFNAFMLPSPSVDPEIMKRINQKKSEVNPSFLSALNEFKFLMKTALAPKKSFTDGELVTGQGKNYLLSSFLFNASVKPELVTRLFLGTCVSHGHTPHLYAQTCIFVESTCGQISLIY